MRGWPVNPLGPSGPSIRIHGGTVLTMDDAAPVVQGDVLVRDGRIVSVGGSAANADADIDIDATGCYVLPGFVQAHLHLCQTLFRNRADDLDLIDWLRTRIWPLEAAHDEASARASARLGLAEMLLAGVTSVLDMGTVHHTGAIIEEALASGIRGHFGKALMDCGEAVPAGLLQSAGAGLDESLDLHRRWDGAGDGRIRYAFAPRFVLSCTDELLARTAELSRERGIPIHTHAAESRREAAIVRAERGTTNIRHLHRLGMSGELCRFAHCVWADGEEREILASTGTRVLHCPGSNLKLGSGMAPVPELLERGVRVGLGSDGAPCNNTLDPFMDMRLAALIQCARTKPGRLPARQILRMATLGGAQALGLDDEVGAVTPGRKADLLVLDMGRAHAFGGDDPHARVVYSARAGDVTHVLVDGRLVVQDRRLLTLDEQETVARAGEALDALLARAELR